MRQRLGLAEILVKQPVVAILDEPTNGLDPQATHELLGLIGELRGDGMTILLSSHLLGLVETICDRVALFNQGKVGLSGRVEDLTRDVLGGSYVVEVEAENIDLPSVLSDLPGVAAVASPGGQKFRVDADRDLRPDIARLVVGRGGALRNMAIRRAGLDEVYVKYFERARAGETEAAHAA
jgi:ABC-2 type transport system ATP-binding protein